VARALRRNETSRTVLNRQALTALQAGFVEGMGDMGRAVIERSRERAPDQPPLGKGLVQTGNWVVYAGTKKVRGTATRPTAVKLSRTGITLVGGFDFPARFNEEGTIHQPARPFVTPSLLEVVPDAHDYLRAPVRRALATVR
jgi:hypothetical protein